MQRQPPIHAGAQLALPPSVVTVIVTVTKLVGPRDGLKPDGKGTATEVPTSEVTADVPVLMARAWLATAEVFPAAKVPGEVVPGTNAVVPVA